MPLKLMLDLSGISGAAAAISNALAGFQGRKQTLS